jgi:hypothetical protein
VPIGACSAVESAAQASARSCSAKYAPESLPGRLELTQFNGLDTEVDNTPRIATWIGSTGGREFSVDLAMRIVQNGDGTATCDFEARTFLGS